MKYIFALILCLLPSVALAHGGWRPCTNPPYPPAPQIYVPSQAECTLSTYVKPRVYYQWTPYFVLKPVVVEQRKFLVWKTNRVEYVSTLQWVHQAYYSY